MATLALVRNDTTPTKKSAFFGDVQHRQKYLQDAFLLGVLAYLRSSGVPTNWDSVLQALKFNVTSWDVSSWIETTGGNAGNVSRRVATAVFQSLFSAGTLAANQNDMPTLLAGDNAEIKVRVSDLTPKGTAKRSGFTETTFPINGTKALNIGSARHIRIVDESINIGKLDVVDQASPLSTQYRASALRRGVILPTAPGTLRLLVGAEYYGGTRSELKINISWT